MGHTGGRLIRGGRDVGDKGPGSKSKDKKKKGAKADKKK